MFKQCTECKDDKPATLELFHKRRENKDGLHNKCKMCISASGKIYREANREKLSAKRKAYYAANRGKERSSNKVYMQMNKERVYAKQKEQRMANKDKVLAQSKAYYELNRDKVLAKGRRYRKENPERYAAIKKRSREKHKEAVVAYRKLYREKNRSKISAAETRRLRTSLNYKLRSNMRSRIWHALKSGVKSADTVELTGCSMEVLRVHLEYQFKPGMTWDNYGVYGWHIDHIRPLTSFDLTDPEEQKIAFNFKNLQPLWAEENLRKGAKEWHTGHSFLFSEKGAVN